MQSHILSVFSLTLVIISLLGCSQKENPTLQSSGDIESDLAALVNHAYSAIWSERDPAKFVSAFLSGDVVITASDSAKVWTGAQENIGLIAELMDAYPVVKPRVVQTTATSSITAFQFVEFELLPVDPGAPIQLAKSLYVWVKTEKGWRVVADHYSFAGMEAP